MFIMTSSKPEQPTGFMFCIPDAIQIPSSDTVMNLSVLRPERELLSLNPLDRVKLSVKYPCEYYLLNMDILAVVTEWIFPQISGAG